MDAFEAIMSRRSVAKLRPDAPEREAVEELLEAAVMAPNHHLTEPWRFVVLKGEALDALGEAMADRVRSADPNAYDIEQKVALERARPNRAPVIVVVVYVPSSNPKAVETEDRFAVGAAMQNFLLAARARGLGTYLRTGPAARDPSVAAALGVQHPEEIAGFIYLGYPADQPAPESTPRRTGAAAKTIWKGWE